MELRRLLDDARAGVHDVAGVIQHDPAFSAKLLQLVNSSFVGLARRLSNVEEAVSYLGLQTVRSLSLSIGIYQAFSAEEAGGAGFCDRLSQHGTACAKQARRLVGDQADAEHAFTAALLQDIGQLVLASNLPDMFRANLAAARDREVPLQVVEQEQGFTHAHVGAYLLGLWGLPAAVVDAVARHHDPPPAEAGRVGPAEATQLAQLMVASEAAGEQGGAGVAS